jgi:hypothetical protein
MGVARRSLQTLQQDLLSAAGRPDGAGRLGIYLSCKMACGEPHEPTSGGRITLSELRLRIRITLHAKRSRSCLIELLRGLSRLLHQHHDDLETASNSSGVGHGLRMLRRRQVGRDLCANTGLHAGRLADCWVRPSYSSACSPFSGLLHGSRGAERRRRAHVLQRINGRRGLTTQTHCFFHAVQLRSSRARRMPTRLQDGIYWRGGRCSAQKKHRIRLDPPRA